MSINRTGKPLSFRAKVKRGMSARPKVSASTPLTASDPDLLPSNVGPGLQRMAGVSMERSPRTVVSGSYPYIYRYQSSSNLLGGQICEGIFIIDKGDVGFLRLVFLLVDVSLLLSPCLSFLSFPDTTVTPIQAWTSAMSSIPGTPVIESKVKIVGLKRASHLNGRVGTVKAILQQAGRMVSILYSSRL